MEFKRKQGFYERYVKRVLDIICALLIIILFWWLYLIIAFMVMINMGRPVIFKQARPGKIDPKTGKEGIFYLYKFRSMTNQKGVDGKVLPDEQRLNDFGRWLRSSSLDEIPEVLNILMGEMSFIGPRPQLVRDLVFMNENIRLRHIAKPGLTGLAQVNGRNALSWDEKFEWDLKYIEKVNFINDTKILFETIKKVFGHKERSNELNVTFDYGDWLLLNGKVSQQEYMNLQKAAERIMEGKR